MILLNNKIYFFLDGDKKNNYRFKGRERLTAQESKDVEFLKKQVKCAYGMEIETFSDGGNGGRRDDQKCEIYLKYLQFYESNLFIYLKEESQKKYFYQVNLLKKSINL